MAELKKFLSDMQIALDDVDLMRARFRPGYEEGKRTLATAVREALKGAPKTDITVDTKKQVCSWLESQLKGHEATTKVLQSGYMAALSALRRTAAVPEVVQVTPNAMSDVWADAEEARKRRAKRGPRKKAAEKVPAKEPTKLPAKKPKARKKGNAKGGRR